MNSSMWRMRTQRTCMRHYPDRCPCLHSIDLFCSFLTIRRIEQLQPQSLPVIDDSNGAQSFWANTIWFSFIENISGIAHGIDRHWSLSNWTNEKYRKPKNQGWSVSIWRRIVHSFCIIIRDSARCVLFTSGSPRDSAAECTIIMYFSIFSNALVTIEIRV